MLNKNDHLLRVGGNIVFMLTSSQLFFIHVWTISCLPVCLNLMDRNKLLNGNSNLLLLKIQKDTFILNVSICVE